MRQPITEPCVAIVGDGEGLTDRYREWLSATCQSVRIVDPDSDPDALIDVDATADVIVIDDRPSQEILEAIDIYVITSPTILITADRLADETADLPVDRRIIEPVTETTLTETVECLYIEAMYSQLLDRYYTLSAKRAEVEFERPSGTLETTPEYQILMTELSQLQQYADSRVEDALDRFDRRVFKTI